MTFPEPIADGPLRFDAAGLIPAVIQESDSDTVLMIGFMNVEALEATRQTGRVHFWSRSRSKLWRKGETSGSRADRRRNPGQLRTQQLCSFG